MLTASELIPLQLCEGVLGVYKIYTYIYCLIVLAGVDYFLILTTINIKQKFHNVGYIQRRDLSLLLIKLPVWIQADY